MANIAYKYRLYPNVKQQELFMKTFGCCRKVWNLMLNDKIENYKQTILNLQKRIDNLYNEGKIKNKITVEWAHKEDLQGFSCENEEFFSINQKI